MTSFLTYKKRKKKETVIIGNFQVTLSLCYKTSPSVKPSHEFYLFDNERIGKKHFYMNGFAQRLVLTREATWEWHFEWTPLTPKLKRTFLARK